MIGKLAVTVAFAALLSAAPSFAQDTSQQPIYKPQSGQGSSSDQQGSQNSGQQGSQSSGQSVSQGDESGNGTSGQTKKKLQQNTQSGQDMNQQQTSDEGTGTTKKKKNQQNTQSGQDMDQQQATDQGTGTTKKKKNQQNTQSGQDMDQQQATDQGTGTTKKKNQQNTQSTGQGNSTTTKQQNAAGQDNTKVTTGATGKTTEIDTRQKTIIRKTIVSEHIHRVPRDRINVNLAVGVAIPSTIELQPLPAEVIRVVPEYEGYLFFVLDDGTIVIVDPDTHHVVYVLTA